MTIAFIIVVTLSLIEALVSFRDGLRFMWRFRAVPTEPPDPWPAVSLILPCRGVDPGLEQNLTAFFGLDYPDFEIVLVTGHRSDPAVAVMESVQRRHPAVRATIHYAGTARSRGQKVHNLLHALRYVRENTTILAFGDSDIRPDRAWLRHLVAPVATRACDVSTGFRWYVPQSWRFWSVLRSVWNAGIAGLMGSPSAPFAWGGSMAIGRSTFEEAQVAAFWDGALSDDYALTKAMRQVGKTIRFQPRCIGFTHEDCERDEFLAWRYRQLAITRVYHPQLWQLGLLSEGVNNLAFWGGLTVVTFSLLRGLVTGAAVLLAILLLAIYLVRSAKAWLRVRAVMSLYPEHRSRLKRFGWAYATWGPVASLVTLTGLVRTLFSREIEWRGIRYRMRSPFETEVVGGG